MPSGPCVLVYDDLMCSLFVFDWDSLIWPYGTLNDLSQVHSSLSTAATFSGTLNTLSVWFASLHNARLH